MTTAAANNRRVVLTIYRSMLRWCNDVDPSIPLADLFIEYSNSSSSNSSPSSTRINDSLADGGTVRDVIRESFRKEGGSSKERISEAMAALRHLNELKLLLVASDSSSSSSLVEQLVGILAQDDDDDDDDDDEEEDDTFDEEDNNDSWTEDLINAVDWLPAIEVMESSGSSSSSSGSNDEHNDDDDDDAAAKSILPLFPMGGPVYTPAADNVATPLPLFTSFSDIPIPGVEISLKIFEPRYRQLYQDILTSGSKKFVVPFCHPTIPSKYARHGLLYEVVQVQEVADQTNGVIQYLVNHLVTKPIYIDRIVNPEAWSTRATYLQVEGRVVNDEFTTPAVVEPLQRMLHDWADDGDDDSSHALPKRALGGLQSDGLWGFVNVWNTYLQQELLSMQVRVAAEIQMEEAKEDVKTEELQEQRRLRLTKELQQPHRPRLLSLQLDMALLVPTLLQQQADSNHQIEYLLQVIAKERQFLEQKKRKPDKTTEETTME